MGSIRERVIGVANPREVWLVTGAHGVNEFYNVALPPILPLLVADFGISYGAAGALLTVYFVTYSVFQLPAGMLADRIGQRWLLAAGMLVLSGGVVLAAAANTFETLLVAQAIGGIGGSTYHPSGMSLISDLEGGATEGKAMGVHGFGGVLGTALAPVLIGGAAVVFDWRVALAVAAAVGVLYTAAFLVLFRDVEFGDGGRGLEADGGGAAGLRSRFAAAVAVPLERWVLLLFLANLAISTQISAARTFTTSYLVDAAGMSTSLANGVFFAMLVGAGLSSLGGGTLADSVDRRRLGVSLMVISMAALATTGFVPPVPILLGAWFFLLGAILWAAVPTMNALTSSYSERAFSGSLFGVMLTAGSIGGAGGPLVFGLAAEAYGLRAAFPMVATVSVLGAVAFLLVGKT